MTTPEPEITITRSLRVYLERDHLEYILKEWAKTQGFTERVNVSFECCHNVSLTESFSGAEGPAFPFEMNPKR